MFNASEMCAVLEELILSRTNNTTKEVLKTAANKAVRRYTSRTVSHSPNFISNIIVGKETQNSYSM
jgi:hypothetical protein